MDAAASYENVSRGLERCRKVHMRSTVRGSLRRLEACYFESEFVQRSSSLLALLGFFEGRVAGDCQSFAVDEVGGRGANIRLQSRSDGQKGARKSPKPFRWFVFSQSDERFL